MALYVIIEGATKAIRVQLLEAGLPIDLTDCAVELLITDRYGITIDNPGVVSVIDDFNGKVQLLPASDITFDASKSPYLVRWKIIDSDDLISYVPTGHRDNWNIVGA